MKDLYGRRYKPWDDPGLQENEPCSKCGCLGCSECGKPPQDCSLNESLICPCCEELTGEDFTLEELEQVEENIEKLRGGNLTYDNSRQPVKMEES